ncbi:Phosphatidylinositol 4-phosphate 5-kinase 1 [Schistosoma japonicum]|nr:Phosphatidylinositol 4-phosphate 5-kinase 1 [Schistosoma japonicum]
MASPQTPKIKILDDEENIINIDDENLQDESSLKCNENALESINYMQLFDLYTQIVTKCSRENKKTFGIINEVTYNNGNLYEGRLNYRTDGSIYYDGEWDSGFRHGYGVYHYSNDATYEGQWKDGKRHGEGTMHWSDRDEIYTGSWVNGKQHGLGCHAWHILRVRTSQYSLPNVYDGQWANGKRNGLGTFHYPNGSKYVGYWKDNLKHGKGTLILKDGRIFERIFYEDRLVDENFDSIPSSLDQPSLERLDTRIPLVKECLSDSTEKINTFKDTSDSNLLENYLKPHISPSDYTHSELQNMQNVITTYLTPLRSIYRYYGKLSVKQLPDNTIILRYIQFCQFLKDCKLHQHTSLAALDRIIAISYGSEDIDEINVQNPEKLISFGTFVNILVILACNFKPSDALLCLLTQAIIPNACKLSGVIYQDVEKSKEIQLFLQPLHQAYKFLVGITRKFQKSILPPPYTITIRNFLFILKDFKLFDRRLVVKDVIELTFFDFYEALIQCTMISILKKDEPQTDNVEDKIETLTLDVTDMPNRKISHRPSTSKQLKSNTSKKQKEKKNRIKRSTSNRKISLSQEIEKTENQNVALDEMLDQEEQSPQQDAKLTETDSLIQSEPETWESSMKCFLNKFLQSIEELQFLHSRIYHLEQSTKCLPHLTVD